MFRSAGYLAFDGIMIAGYSGLLVFSAYSLGMTVKRTGTRINARSSVFFLSTLTSILKIISFAGDISLVYSLYYFAEYTSYLSAFYCFVSLLFAWLRICMDVLGAHKQYWLYLRYGIWFFMTIFAGPVLFDAIALGPLKSNLFSYASIRFYLTGIILVPVLLLTSVVMLAAAVRVLVVLNKSGFDTHIMLQRKIGITCLCDSLLQLFAAVFLATEGISSKVFFSFSLSFPFSFVDWLLFSVGDLELRNSGRP